jgi:hypothetical protein
MAASTTSRKEIAYPIDDPLFASFLELNKTDSDRIASFASLPHHTVAQSATPYLSEGQPVYESEEAIPDWRKH